MLISRDCLCRGRLAPRERGRLSESFVDQATNPKHTLPAASFPELSCAKSPLSVTPGPGARPRGPVRQPEPTRSLELCDPVLASHGFPFKPQQRLWATRPPPALASRRTPRFPPWPRTAQRGPRLWGPGRSEPSSDSPLRPRLSSCRTRGRSNALVLRLLLTPASRGAGEAPGARSACGGRPFLSPGFPNAGMETGAPALWSRGRRGANAWDKAGAPGAGLCLSFRHCFGYKF